MSIKQICLLVTLVSPLGCRQPVTDSADHASSQATRSPPRDSGATEPPDRADDLGGLRIEVSGGTPTARRQFARGLLALHSFWYDEATRQFAAAIAEDPSFSMAYWGLAMSHAKLLWGEDDLEAGRSALTRMPSPNLLPPRDQAWVVAALSLFRRATLDVRSSRQELLAVMEQVHAQFPDDESATFLALALLSTLRPDAPDQLQLRKRAGALAEAVLTRNPRHPGAAHYLIHAYDTPELARLALPVALRYADLAPAAYHARHMPAHIFVRLGLWKQAADSCQAAWDASVAWVRRHELSPDQQDFHSLSWLIELGFERGRRSDADRALATFAEAVRAGLPHPLRAAYANQIASYLARTGEWDRADELLAPLRAPARDAGQAGRGDACGGHWPAPTGTPGPLLERRAVLGTLAHAAARRRDVTALERWLAERDLVDAELRPLLARSQPADVVASTDQLRGLVRKALIARARGDDRALVLALGPLARDQDLEFVGEGIAGGILHHEDRAEALLRLGQVQEARDEYRSVLARHAGRARALLGAARAAMRAQDPAAARELYRQLLETWRDADDSTEGLLEARRAIAAGIK